jgi:group I intron endonuclease
MRYLYAITNLVNGKKYVGIAADPQRRWWKHRNGPKAGGSLLVKRAIDKYGLDNFHFEVLGQGNDTKTIAWCEEQAILIFQSMVPNGYNLSAGGECGAFGVKQSPEVAARRAASNRGKKRSPECCRRMSLAARKRPPRSLENRRKQSQRQLGHASSEKQRAAASAARSRPVLVNGVAFASIREAAARTGMTYSSLKHRFMRYKARGSFPPGWAYLPKNGSRCLERQ